MSSESDHISNREKLIEFVKSELVGPCLKGKELDCSGDILFDSWEDAQQPWIQKNNGDEIIWDSTPYNRYGIGVLYPQAVSNESEENEVDGVTDESESDSDHDKVNIKSIGKRDYETLDSDDFDLSLSNAMKPSSMAISFLVELPENSKLKVDFYGGIYKGKTVRIAGRERKWYLRQNVSETEILESEVLKSMILVNNAKKTLKKGFEISIESYSRPDIYSPGKYRENRRLITICLVNRSKPGNLDSCDKNEMVLFQAGFKISVLDGSRFCAYPDQTFDEENEQASVKRDEELESFRLLYNSRKTYAIGHGCAAIWNDKKVNEPPDSLIAEPFPQYETPSITPDIEKDGSILRLSMTKLAGLESGGDKVINDFITEYSDWIEYRKKDSELLSVSLKKTASLHLKNAESCLERIRSGLDFINEDSLARKAFEFANKAILMQQQANTEKRVYSYDKEQNRKVFKPEFKKLLLDNLKKNTGYWRPFQIGFILSSLRSSVLDCPEREDVDLIWFPTGGGKTEAYLGLAAFVMFYKRLVDKNDDGVNVIMRYTLRLLTTQQFQRASRLICAMEEIRKENNELGQTPYSIGIWVGSANTPNNNQYAHESFKKLKKEKNAENPFVIRQCPWCGAEMGTHIKQKLGNGVLGYAYKNSTIQFECPDKECSFNKFLPIYVIDEEIYKKKPSLIIGTVDKFAQLAWKPEAGSIFGIDDEGYSEKKPPGLIIQDELHLISGPLGTMVGLYETVIEDLCCVKNEGKKIKPKIVCSTATIKNYREQVKALFAREKSNIFPPPGLDAGDSFFAKYATDAKGDLLPGRKYLGIYAPGLSSMQTLQVRFFSALLQGVLLFDQPEEKDPWWTLMLFYNSIRELGGALSLIQSDIPGNIKSVNKRHGFNKDEKRYLNNVRELTSRMTNNDVPKALEELEKKYIRKNSKSVDVCLASSIIEVGIDVDRLSLMSVIGQPKSVSQYIQVTGRVGRKWWEKPGLVGTLFSSSKPRDRSYFEKFQSVHSQMYAQVEPTSITPFSAPVIDRALHALLAVYLRIMGDKTSSVEADNLDDSLFNSFSGLILERVSVVDKSQSDYVIKKLNKLYNQMKTWDKKWWYKDVEKADSLLGRYESWLTENSEKNFSWITPTSMRNVDAECQMDITNMYNYEEGE
ncbi:MAG: helicase-related protein [Candidatus Muiribacteriota bacterium]